MKVDITSMFFNSKIEGKTATPAWRTSIGQNKSKECRIETDVPGVTDIIIGMTYKMRTDLHNLSMTDVSGDLMLCAVFDKIYVNGNRVDGVSYTLLLLRETSDSHEGRLQICYAPKITFNGQSNSATIDRMRETLGCSINGCWFVYEIAIKNQDELHFSAVVVDENQPALYTGTSQDRSRLWRSLLPTADGETSYIPEDDTPLQVIYYGAPGTGKSYSIKEQTAEAEANKRVFRTTFHPDSDYSTFVGCYKPSMESKEKLYDKNELISKLSVIKNTGVTYPCHKFAAKYWESLKQLSREAKKDILSACEFPESMVVEIDKGIVIGEELSHSVDQKQIVYRFVPQAFTNAYVKAYQTTEPVYLVIEEINRGNCAQIFGDLFQLLDRDDSGISKYPIIADTDLGNHICERLQSLHVEGIDEAILNGQELVLPSNLYILASMNTSDQSLFPIDSAFKRRWDWEYIPIKYSNSDWRIDIAGYKYSWIDFQTEINKRIFGATESEDKQLGDFFVKADDNNIISSKLLLNKVIFYLWNDVCKDGDGDIFKVNTDLDYSKELDPAKNEDITFSKFFKETDLKLKQWMRYLNIKPLESQDDDDEEKEDEAHQQDEGVKPNEAKPDTYSKPEYKSIIENMLPQLSNEDISIFKNGFDWSFSDMPGSYARMSLALDAPAKNKKANVKVWVPAPTGYSKSAECFAYLKDRGGEDIIRTTASKYGYEYEELGIHSKNPNPVVGWKITIPMTFAPENSQAESQKLLDILSEVRTAFDPIISDFLQK